MHSYFDQIFIKKKFCSACPGRPFFFFEMPSEDYDIELPFGVPPILPSVQNQLKKYLLCPELLPIHSIDNTQQLWPRTPQPSLLLNADLAPTGTSLKVIRHHATGEILGFDEIQVKGCGEKGDNSYSLQRAPGLPTDSVRGSTRNLPFWPGGFAEPEDIEDLVKVTSAEFDEKDLETIPPGFSHGVLFMADGKTPVTNATIDKEEPVKASTEVIPERVAKPSNVVNIFDLVEQEKELFKGVTGGSDAEVDSLAEEGDADADIIPEAKALPVPPVLQIKNTPRASKKSAYEWAEELDVTEPMKNFKDRLPNPALTYEFELDTFQKQAILKLEEREDVFVAAHTSAGKTVVAEYAIALSRKHNCRTVYTSPIKALSNQKFRDFRDKFSDVGLITGDLQKNEKASCLVMTTEILRSMLYGGSDVIRDLEYVVLDEVHYLNDNERGHVWEEVLILLPKHVSVVLLSATVPNVLEFANWVGRTREKKMYVVVTTKRPVPLEHYLYTGCGGATRDDRFLVLGQDGVFSKYNYEDAQRKVESSTKGPPRGRPNLAKEKTIWSGLIAHLKKKEGLPVVAFTLSRKRCDMRAQLLASMESAGDLTSKEEKFKIQRFFNDCTERLCKQDRGLPQVLTMYELLSRGIGVHHSGILPFLKEVVEMLFQVGYVKLLFATETFAMGVNMPARTVLFDAISKYDGSCTRPLKPDEYIQMAGRAGRRGLDDKGIVLILCSGGLPAMDDLEKMMIGKPTKLESKFRLTYQMMLKLLRAGRLTVGEMMSKSFQEDHRSDKSAQVLKNLKEAQQRLKEWKKPAYLDKETEDFCLQALDWLQYRDEIWEKHFNACFGKLLQPGRVLLICHKKHRCKLGAYINTNSTTNTLDVLVLSNADEIQRNKTTNDDALYETMLSKLFWLAQPRNVFVPGGQVVHELLKVPLKDVVEVTGKCLPKDCMPNPKDFFFMKKCGGIIEELTILSSKPPEYLSSQNKALDVKTDFMDLERLKAPLLTYPCHQLPNFGEQLVAAFEKHTLEERIRIYKSAVSDESLQLNKEREQRLQVLKELQYINNDHQVQMKGRVACGMGSNELMITELVMHNVLTKRPVEEIAALLSGLVFQIKSNEDSNPEYSESLREGIKLVESYHEQIEDIERKYGVKQGPDDCPPNFGLAEVVYAWAKNKPFKDIMSLTDCQEGLIVRCIQQLNELMLDVKLAARMIGDEELETKMDDASKAIKRDIVFSASLYTEMGKINL